MNPESMHEMSYYPDFERWWKSIDGVMRVWAGRSLDGGATCPAPRATSSSSTWTSSGSTSASRFASR